ncbi:MAG: LacI family transcriptional regulator [Candidatus Pacebacteria bacterium]|nr:LacI family transcriptional regulator [Candidatus Paceibacterota bacterium]
MANLKDIAAQARVSVSTASAVLNGAQNFAEKTRRRVLKAAADLEYAPNLAARAMRRSPGFGDRPRTNIIGHITRMIDTTIPDRFIALRSLLLTHLADLRGYYVLPICYDRTKPFACPPVRNGQVDGVLAGLPDFEIAESVSHLAPLILMDVPFAPELLPDVPLVNFDMRFGMRRLVRHLFELGHSRVGALTFRKDNPFSYHAVRCVLMQEALENAGLELHESLSRERYLTPETNREVMDAFADEAIPLIRTGEITALVLPDDVYAVSVINRLTTAGVSVPADVSVTGFGATPLSPRTVPPLPLTTVDYPWEALLQAALDLLIAEIEGRNHRHGEILIRPDFIAGASTDAPRHKNGSCKKGGICAETAKASTRRLANGTSEKRQKKQPTAGETLN